MLVNDVVFALHAVAATIVIIIQCCIYDRGQQRVSNLAKIILGVYGICTVVMAILAGTAVVHGLDFLYFCSYVKLSITIMKYIPQVNVILIHYVTFLQLKNPSKLFVELCFYT